MGWIRSGQSASEPLNLSVNLNVIVNVIGIFHGLSLLTGIYQTPCKMELFEAFIGQNLPILWGSSPVSRTNPKPLILSGVSGILGGPKKALECNFECNWSSLTSFYAHIYWHLPIDFKKYFCISFLPDIC